MKTQCVEQSDSRIDVERVGFAVDLEIHCNKIVCAGGCCRQGDLTERWGTDKMRPHGESSAGSSHLLDKFSARL